MMTGWGFQHNSRMGSALRWTAKAIRLCGDHPWQAFLVACLMFPPGVLYAIALMYITEWGPTAEFFKEAGKGWMLLLNMVGASVMMPFVSGSYAATYGFVLDRKLSMKDYLFGLSRPFSATFSFLAGTMISVIGLFFFGGASVIWAMPVQSLSDKTFPSNFGYSIHRTTRNITTLLHAMGVLIWISVLGLLGMAVFGLTWYLAFQAGDFLPVLMVLMSPLLIMAIFLFPFIILVHCVGVRDEMALEEGIFEGRMKGFRPKTPVEEPPEPLHHPESEMLKPMASREVTCGHCGAVAPRHARFCPGCRKPLA